jgi:hypothetical protein
MEKLTFHKISILKKLKLIFNKIILKDIHVRQVLYFGRQCQVTVRQ